MNKIIAQGNSRIALQMIQKYREYYTPDNLGRAIFININANWCHPSSDKFPAFIDIFRALIATGANVNAAHEGTLGNSFFHIIIRKYADEPKGDNLQGIRDLCFLLLKVLVASGVRINSLNLVGLTPLDYAFHNSRTWDLDRDLVNLIIKQGGQRTFILGQLANLYASNPVPSAKKTLTII